MLGKVVVEVLATSPGRAVEAQLSSLKVGPAGCIGVEGRLALTSSFDRIDSVGYTLGLESRRPGRNRPVVGLLVRTDVARVSSVRKSSIIATPFYIIMWMVQFTVLKCCDQKSLQTSLSLQCDRRKTPFVPFVATNR